MGPLLWDYLIKLSFGGKQVVLFALRINLRGSKLVLGDIPVLR